MRLALAVVKKPVQATNLDQEQSPPTYCAPEAATNHVAFNASEAVARNSGTIANNCVIKVCKFTPEVLAPWLFLVGWKLWQDWLAQYTQQSLGIYPKGFPIRG